MSDFKHKVLVVGSGAGGAMAAYTLTKLGHKVLVLEAGSNYDPTTDSRLFRRTHEPHGIVRGNQYKHLDFYDATGGGR